MDDPALSIDTFPQAHDLSVSDALRAFWRRVMEQTRLSPRVAVLVLVISGALFFRCVGLGVYGFSEDEINKLGAIRAYARLDFTSNAEHPMLMKLAMLGSVTASQQWNRLAERAGLPAVSQEAALRVPNALAGTLATLIIFLLAESMFGLRTAAWASFLWAVDVNAVATNRIGKEDTLMVLFLFAGAWCYWRGKQEWARDAGRGRRWYSLSGAAFGLMSAAKYMPWFYGLHSLYARAAYPPGSPNRPNRTHYATMAIAFLAANFTVLLPSTWRYVVSYIHGDTVRHTGYFFANHLYTNLPGTTPFGLPPWFYLAFLGTKVPLPVLAAFAVGLWSLVVRRKEPAFVFLRVFTVFFLLPYSFMAGKFARYLLPFFFVMDIIAAIGIVHLLQTLRAVRWRRGVARAASALAFAIFCGAPVYAVAASAPYYSLYRNVVGAQLGPPGWMFADDELYDAGLSEATFYVARTAAPHAIVSSDAPGVVREYLDQAGRHDIRSVSLSAYGAPRPGVDGWVLAQTGRTYYETEALLRTLRLRPPARTFMVDGAVGVEVFRSPR